MSRLLRHFEAAQHAFRNFDLDPALEHLDRVLEFVPNLPGARNGVAKVRQRQADIARVQLGLQTARAGRQAVRRPGGRREHGAGWSIPLARPSGSLVRTLETCCAPRRWRPRRGTWNGPIPPRRGSLSPEPGHRGRSARSRAGLKRTPPDPPTALDAQVLGDRIRLSWTPPPPDGLGPLTFVVVRKRGGASSTPLTVLASPKSAPASLTTCTCTPGDTVGYAILSKRGGVESIAAISLGPFVFLADVKDVRVEFRNQRSRAGLVAAARRIRSPRDPQAGSPPRDPRDGDRIATAVDHSLDRNLDPNEVYHYGIYAIYKMADGRLFPAPGVVVSARPQTDLALESPRLVGTRAARSHRLGRAAARLGQDPAHGSPLPHPAGTRLSVRRGRLALEGRWIEPVSPGRCVRRRAAIRGPLLLHAPDRLGRHVDRRAWRGAFPGRRPSEPRATRAGGGLSNGSRRNSGHPSLELGGGRRRHPDRRPPGPPPRGARRSRRDHRDRLPPRLRSP